ncbi:MAG: hypothetical protein VB980_06485, partial [Opitutales bacterium]
MMGATEGMLVIDEGEVTEQARASMARNINRTTGKKIKAKIAKPEVEKTADDKKDATAVNLPVEAIVPVDAVSTGGETPMRSSPRHGMPRNPMTPKVYSTKLAHFSPRFLEVSNQSQNQSQNSVNRTDTREAM